MLQTFVISAQNHQIKGEVYSDKNEVIPYANVSLYQSDSILITGVSTDSEGIFSISKVRNDNYTLCISCIGYETYKTQLDGISSNINLGTVILQDKQVNLKDVEISSANIINKTNCKILFPSVQQKESSTNGLNLLQNAMLPGIKVNALMNSISTISDGELQLRINDIQVSEKEVIALAPNDIVYIEYIENPGLRYDNASGVLNFKTKRYQTGGSINMDLMQSPNIMFSEDQISSRLSINKSEIRLNYSLSLRDFYEYWRTNNEGFLFENGSTLYRSEEGLPGRYTNQIHNLSFSYNYQEADKYLFNINLKYIGNLEPHNDYNSILSSTDTDYDVSVKDYKDTKTYYPSVDLYYLRHLSKTDDLMFNVVGTFVKTDLNGIYQEVSNINTSNISRNIEGKKYSLIGEALYENRLPKGRLTIGLKHTQSTTENSYYGSTNFNTDLDCSETNLYTEYSREKSKLNYSIGMGISRSWLKQNNEDSYETYNIRPRVNLYYKFSNNMFLRLNAKMDTYSPDLSSLSNVVQAIDLLQIERGNPNLEPYQQYQADLHFEYHKGLFTGIAKSQYIIADNAIMGTTLRENDKFIRTYNNQDKWTKYNAEITTRIGMLWKIMQFSFTGGLNRYMSDGKSYFHTYNNFYYLTEVLLAYKSWIFLLNANNSYNNFWGENVIGGENMHMIMLMKNHKSYSLGLGLINPFVDNYKRVNENRNQYAWNKREAYVNESSKMIILKFTWNLNFGKRYSTERKRLNNTDNKSGIMNVTK